MVLNLGKEDNWNNTCLHIHILTYFYTSYKTMDREGVSIDFKHEMSNMITVNLSCMLLTIHS